MREHIAQFAREAASGLNIKGPIVEMGARPASGQEADYLDLRSLFPGQDYIGCDIQAGDRVDQIEDIHSLSFEDDSIGAVIALDTLEHVADPVRAMQEVHRVLRPGGVAVITSVMYFPIHAHPWDYWRFTPEGFGQLLTPFESQLVMSMGWEFMPETVFGVGVKGPAPNLSEAMFPSTVETCRTWGAGRPVDFGPMRMTVRELWGFTLKYSGESGRRKLSHLMRRPG